MAGTLATSLGGNGEVESQAPSVIQPCSAKTPASWRDPVVLPKVPHRNNLTDIYSSKSPNCYGYTKTV